MAYPKRRRPNKTADDRRISVCCSEEEYQAIRRAAAKLKIGMSPFLVDAGTEKAETVEAAK